MSKRIELGFNKFGSYGMAMQLPNDGWADLGLSKKNNLPFTPELQNFTAWLDSLDHHFEWTPNGVLFKDLETGELRSAMIGEYICQFHSVMGVEVILILDQRQFDLLTVVLM